MQRIVNIQDVPKAVRLLLGSDDLRDSNDEDSSDLRQEPLTLTVTTEEYSFNGEVYLIYRSYDLSEGKIEFGPYSGSISVANDDKTPNLAINTKGKNVNELQRLVVMKDNRCIALYQKEFEAAAETLINDHTGVKILAQLGIDVDDMPSWQEVQQIT
jgi:hypothetical protein